jgi:hypothetical protein
VVARIIITTTLVAGILTILTCLAMITFERPAYVAIVYHSFIALSGVGSLSKNHV